jgi:glycerophosphoryl diester phosphodiesterase
VTRRQILRTSGGAVSLLAHRGGTGPWRENTLEAFEGARANGADGVELDVRLTSDGEVVVFHDDALESGEAIRDLKKRDLPGYIPDLESAVVACEGMLVNVEIKLDHPLAGTRAEPSRCRALAVAVAEVLLRRRGVIVSSFWPDALVALGEVAPTLATGLLVHPASDAAAAVLQASNLGCSALHPHRSAVTPALVELCRGAGLEVGTWTVNEAADLDNVVSAGVDAVITDDIGLVRTLLGREQSQV